MNDEQLTAIERLCDEASGGRVDHHLLERALGHPSPQSLAEGRVAAWKDRAVVAVTSEKQPCFVLDDNQSEPLRRVPGTPAWYREFLVTQGLTHRIRLFLGDDLLTDTDVAGYGPLSHPLPSVSVGKELGPFSLRSRVYVDADICYRLRISAGVAADVPAPMMIWFDGDYFSGGLDMLAYRLGVVTDNLVHLGRIPPLVHVLIDPAQGRRSEQYDAVSSRLGDHVFGEIIPDAERHVRLRRDGYSVAAGGESSGAAASFGLAWFHNDSVTRVHSGIGSFTGLEGADLPEPRGAFIYSHLVRRERRNIRIWMSDGSRDLNAGGDDSAFAKAGSWPLANVTLADSLGRSGYDVAFRFGSAGHNGAQGALDLPESLTWLWRDYDPRLTSAIFAGAVTGFQIKLREGTT
ncbi:MAG TPA: hypothetical protein VG757_05100 [Devosia sp.]|nr:hypothetical protein [Devosia sp.]